MGTRKTTHTDTRTDEDHPHAYGDKRWVLRCSPLVSGSSPRVWGQEKKKPRTNRGCGIIPTRMGTRYLFSVFAVAHRDHPHAYGDKHQCLKSDCFYRGSSPRVWGQVNNNTIALNHLRIIPTRMGTRRSVAKHHIVTRDHPHAYGDKTAQSQILQQ